MTWTESTDISYPINLFRIDSTILIQCLAANILICSILNNDENTSLVTHKLIFLLNKDQKKIETSLLIKPLTTNVPII